MVAPMVGPQTTPSRNVSLPGERVNSTRKREKATPWVAEARMPPSLIGSAVEELLRYDSPVQLRVRVARETVEIGGRRIAKGQRVLILVGAANRDPARFPDPDRLDIARPDNRHLAFGHGIHFCTGAPLARLEGAIAIRRLLRRFPRLELTTDQLAWRETLTLRALNALPVSAR